MKSRIVGIFVAAGLMAGAAQAAEVKVFAAAAMNGPFKELIPAFEQAYANMPGAFAQRMVETVEVFAAHHRDVKLVEA